MFAVWREPRDTDRTTAGYLFRIDRKNVLLIVLREWVIDLVHRNRVRIVIDGYIDRAPRCKLDADARAATARKIIDDHLAE